jgi:hypothetical protein
LEDGSYDGLAFGAEFCHRLLPGRNEVLETAARCRSLGIGFSLVTPVLREGAFDETTAWLESVAQELGETEWVVNDWGLLLWGRERGLPLLPVAGRLMSRQRRGPRTLELVRSATPAEGEALKGSVWDDRRVSSLLEELGVVRVELDALLQGVRRPSLGPGVALSLCGPWLPVTVAPSCAWSVDPMRCPTTCREHSPIEQRTEEDPHPLWSRGNTLFVRGDDSSPAVLAAALGADRLVWAQEIPG